MKDLNTSPLKPYFRWRINKRLYVVLICLFVSSLFWLLIALSHDYPSTLTFPVSYVNMPGKKVVMNELPTKIDVQVKASGFKIISWGFQKNQKPVQVDVAGSMQNKSSTAEVMSFPTRYFLTDFSRELGKEVLVTGFIPDSVIFNFSDLATKTVPVFPDYQVSFERQFDSTGPAVVSPSEVKVSGPPTLLHDLKSISTERIKLDNLKGTVHMQAKLVKEKLIVLNVDEVNFSLPVEKFTEGFLEIEINPVNVKEGYTLKTFPDKVKVRFLVALSQYNSINESLFDAVVDGDNLEKNSGTRLSVDIITKPSSARITMVEPEKVDYILRKK